MFDRPSSNSSVVVVVVVVFQIKNFFILHVRVRQSAVDIDERGSRVDQKQEVN
jgi:hypothetical protein